jgi:hypothetical protein
VSKPLRSRIFSGQLISCICFFGADRNGGGFAHTDDVISLMTDYYRLIVRYDAFLESSTEPNELIDKRSSQRDRRSRYGSRLAIARRDGANQGLAREL